MTPSGKIELFCEKIASFGYEDCPGYPVWIEPVEDQDSYLGKKYPYQLISPHPVSRLHSQLDNSSLADTYKIKGREPVHIHTADAEELGIKDGDIVEVYNNRGSILAGAKVIEGIVKGVLAIEEGAWYRAENPMEENSRCISGQVNLLTSDRPTSKLAQAITTNTCQVGIRKVQGDVPENSAYETPVIRGIKSSQS